MAKTTVKLHNKSDKPDNVVERENEVLDRCESIESQLPSWLRGFFMYLKTGVLPMTRLSYLSDVKFFLTYLINETELREKYDDIRKIQPEDMDKIKS
ncbi:MAG: recombinase, partial [Firmicutes bacterium]|nr:recombinase [Bacillota bacterium]